MAIGDVITRHNQTLNNDNMTIICLNDNTKMKNINNYYLEKLQKPIFINGELVYEDLDILEQQRYCNEQMDLLYPEYKRTIMPEEYYVDGDYDYVNFKNDLIAKTRKLIKK